MLCLALAAGQGVAEVHRFAPDWRAEVEPSLTSQEVMTLGERTPLADKPGAFKVRIPTAALVPKLVESVALVVGERENSHEPQSAGEIAAVFVVKPAGGAIESALRVGLVPKQTGEYRVRASAAESLVDWLREHIHDLEEGRVVVETVDGLGDDEVPMHIAISPPRSG